MLGLGVSTDMLPSDWNSHTHNTQRLILLVLNVAEFLFLKQEEIVISTTGRECLIVSSLLTIDYC